MPLEESYREIQLTQGQVTRVSASKYDDVNRWPWQAMKTRKGGKFYVVRYGLCQDGKRRLIYMHRYILGLSHGDPRQGDHISGDTMDNTDENLRVADRSQQQFNKGISKHNKTGYKGVSQRGPNSFLASIHYRGKQKSLGLRSTAKLAYEELYVPAALRLHGEFARFK